MYKSITKCLLLIILSSFFQSCFVAKAKQTKHMKNEFTVENEAIPANFNGKNTTIVCVLRERRSYDKYLESAFEKYYHGDYVFVTREDLENSQYDDLKKYQYLFDYSDGNSRTVTFNNGTSSTVVGKRFYLEDRSNGKRYQSGAEFSFFAKAMKVYAENLEIERRKN